MIDYVCCMHDHICIPQSRRRTTQLGALFGTPARFLQPAPAPKVPAQRSAGNKGTRDVHKGGTPPRWEFPGSSDFLDHCCSPILTKPHSVGPPNIWWLGGISQLKKPPDISKKYGIVGRLWWYHGDITDRSWDVQQTIFLIWVRLQFRDGTPFQKAMF